MSKPANKTLIGAFVLGGAALAIASVMILGSGKFFSHRNKYEIFFQGSVKGLHVGAPVLFRGVKIGEVTKITLYLNVNDLTVVMPVEIEVDPATFKTIDGELTKNSARLKPLIDKGLRAQLQMSSMVTGQLMVYLDLYPDTPVILLGHDNAKNPEIPAIPSGTQELTRKLESLPLQDIAAKLDSTLTGISRLVNSPELVGSVSSANKLINDIDVLVAQNGNLSYQTSKTLEEVSQLTRSLNSLTSYLSRHPEALLRGKRPSKGD